MARPRLAVLLLIPVALLLAGCSAKAASGGEPTVTESSSPAAASATPSTTPTAAASTAPARSKATYGVLTLELQRAGKVDPKMEPAITTFIKLHEDFATMAAGQAQPADLTTIASKPVINFLTGQLSEQRQKKEHSAGTLAIRNIMLAGVNLSRTEQGTTTSAVVAACFDQRKLVTIRPDGTKYFDSTVRQYPTLRISATVNGTKVTAYELKAGSC